MQIENQSSDTSIEMFISKLETILVMQYYAQEVQYLSKIYVFQYAQLYTKTFKADKRDKNKLDVV